MASIALVACAGEEFPSAPIDAGPADTRPTYDGGPMPVENVAPGEDWNANDEAALGELARLYSTDLGRWLTGPRWSWANDVEAAEASYARSGGAGHAEMMLATFELQGGGNFIDDGGYDDEGWWANAWVRAFDLTGDPRYLAMAKTVFDDMVLGWDSVCGGGLWWNKARTYKAAIANELFLLLAASLHNRTPNDTEYLDWAQREWTWFSGIGLVNDQHLVNDGLNNCHNNADTTWTYNQGVILGGLVELFTATGDTSHLAQAEAIADAALQNLVDGQGVLREPCAASGCNGDQVSFKGIFMRNLARLYDVDGRAAYRAFLLHNARALWTHARGPADALGAYWSGPFDVAAAPQHSSAMFVLSAMAEPWTQDAPLVRAAGGASFNHAQGHPLGTLGWACDPPSCPDADFVQRGPFVSYLPAGARSAHFRLAVDITGATPAPLATLDVYDAAQDAVLARRDVAWSDFAEAGISEDFALPYTTTDASHAVEFRVRWNAAADSPQLHMIDVSVDAEQAFTAANLAHDCGRLDRVANWSVDRWRDAASCYLTRGPGVRLDAGACVASFELRVDNFNLDDQPVAKLEVMDVDRMAAVASREVTRGQFASALFQSFALPFTAESGHHYDFRVLWRRTDAAPRLTQRGVYVRHAILDRPVALPYNARGIGNGPGDGAIDGVGSVLAASLLGVSLSTNGHHFELGPTSAGASNVLSGPSAIPLPAESFRELDLIGFAVDGTKTNQPFVVSYGDGSSATVPLTLSDWAAGSPAAGERYALALPFRWSTRGKEYGNFHVFHYVIPLDASRTPASLRLPTDGTVKLLAATLSR